MAELADAHDSKSCGKPCGFESHHRYHKKTKRIFENEYSFYFLEIFKTKEKIKKKQNNKI